MHFMVQRDDMMQETGFNDVWCFPTSVVSIGCFISQFKLRLKDIYIGRQWREAVNISTALTLYKEIKQTFEMSEYLTILNNNKFRNCSAKFRLSSHCWAKEQALFVAIVTRSEVNISVLYVPKTILRTNFILYVYVKSIKTWENYILRPTTKIVQLCLSLLNC